MSIKMTKGYWWIAQGRTADNEGDYEEFGLRSDGVSRLRVEERPINLFHSVRDQHFKIEGE